jgi:GrpB-like predicted nucleotidyltransferase (UPF0157 family)
LSPQRIFLYPHDPRWAVEFSRESTELMSALGEALLAVHHIGSTAISGIRAKPIIDMLAVTDDLKVLDDRNSRFEELGYEVLGEFGIPGRRYFRKNDSLGTRTHQIHAFQTGSAQIARHLAFRDYLRAHPNDARAYEALKQRLANAFPNDIGSYTDGKDSFIQDVDSRAMLWLSSHRFEQAKTTEPFQ